MSKMKDRVAARKARPRKSWCKRIRHNDKIILDRARRGEEVEA